MSAMHSEKKHSGSIARKVIFAFLLAAAAVVVSWGLTQGTFLRMLQTVHSMGEPSPKLQFVNQVFREVVKLDQLQRTQALISDRQPYNIFLKESQHLQHMLDTLRMMSRDNHGQLPRIDSMKSLLRERDRLLLNYIRLRSDVIKNDTLSVQIRRLSDLLSADSTRFDNSVVTTEMKTTTIIEPVDSVIRAPEQKQSFWDRLVGKKKEPEVVRMQRLIQEDLKIHIDTLAIAKEDSLIQEISTGIATIESDMQQKREGLLSQQMQLSRSGNVLISQVLIMLQDIETEEMDLVTEKNIRASELVNTGIGRLKLIVFLFMSGAGLLLFFIFADIAKSNRYRTELIAAKEEAEQLGKVKERFLANMSHELRTPLQTIIGTAEQMKLSGASVPADVDVIYQSSQHLLQSVNEVLDYSRITSGSVTLDSSSFDMEQLLQEVAASIKILAERKGLDFIFVPGDPLAAPLYLGDAFRLKQILYNLLGNAIKFTDKGKVSFRLEHIDFPRRTTFVFSIADTGAGIAPEDHDKIFRQFERIAPDSRQGTGLGLSIVRELVDAFKGAISLESEPGKGSVFTVNISLPKARVADTRPEQDDKVSTSFRERVWVVDDDAFILNLCSGILTKYGIAHQCFHNAADLLKAPADKQIHTILMDIRMPGMDGYALLETLRSMPAFSATRVIALTAQAMPDEKEKIRKQGFDGLLMKPFLEKDLLALFDMIPAPPMQDTQNAVPLPATFSPIIDMAGGDAALIRKTLGSYIDTTREDLRLLRACVSSENRQGLIDILHRLAGRTGQMGAGKLSAVLRQTEIQLRNAQAPWPDAEQLHQIERQLLELLSYTEEYVRRTP